MSFYLASIITLCFYILSSPLRSPTVLVFLKDIHKRRYSSYLYFLTYKEDVTCASVQLCFHWLNTVICIYLLFVCYLLFLNYNHCFLLCHYFACQILGFSIHCYVGIFDVLITLNLKTKLYTFLSLLIFITSLIAFSNARGKNVAFSIQSIQSVLMFKQKRQFYLKYFLVPAGLPTHL